MSRLDLLKSSSTANKKSSTDISSERSMLGEKTKKSQQREDDLNEELLTDDDFENELEDSQPQDLSTDDENDADDDQEVNVIEIDLGENVDLDIGEALVEDEITETVNDEIKDEDLTVNNEKVEALQETEDSLVQGIVDVDYSEEDIKLEAEYTFEHRDQAYYSHVKTIKNGGMEISTAKPLHLDDIVRVSITLTELKEQVGCEARVVSVFPQRIRSADEADDKNKYRYIVQFIGPNASETERVFSKYLLGYKIG